MEHGGPSGEDKLRSHSVSPPDIERVCSLPLSQQRNNSRKPVRHFHIAVFTASSC